MASPAEIELQSPDAAGGELGRRSDGSGGDEELLLHEGGRAASRAAGWVTTDRAVAASWVVNIFLLAVKIVIFAASNSKAVLASLADSAGARGSVAAPHRVGVRCRQCAACTPPQLLRNG
jgi:hypothetical protein